MVGPLRISDGEVPRDAFIETEASEDSQSCSELVFAFRPFRFGVIESRGVVDVYPGVWFVDCRF